MCEPASACLLMEAAGDCHHQRTSACTDQEKKKEPAVVTGHLHGSNKANHKLTSLLATGQRPPIHNFRTKRASGNI